MNRLFIYRLVICLSILFNVDKLFAQSVSPAPWEEIGEQWAEEDETKREEWLASLEELEMWKEHPLNLNEATLEQLSCFPFLSRMQIENFIFYRYTTGELKTIHELQLVEEMDRQTIEYLLPYVCVIPVHKKTDYPSFKQLWKQGKSTVITRLDLPLNRKNGYRNYSDSVLQAYPNRRYIGPSFYHDIRYQYHYKERIYWGFTAKKDAGEPFFSAENRKGYDFYSFYLLLHDLGCLKTLAIGNYRLNFGLGLVMNTGFSLGKSFCLATIDNKPTGIRKHSSTDEYNYFRGAAATCRLKDFEWTAFYSYRRLDGTVNNECITSLKTDGKHRLIRDFEKRNQVVMQLIGTHLVYFGKTFQLGVTFVHNVFNKLFIPDEKPYSVFYPKGKSFLNASVDYRYRWKRMSLSGETAFDKNGQMATLHLFRWTPLPDWHFLLLQRSYARKYQAWTARSIAEGGAIRNEKGIYMGVEASPFRRWNFFVYADFFRFPWLRYQINHPSGGFDGSVRFKYAFTSKWNLSFSYRYKEKEETYHRLRYQLNYSQPSKLTFRLTADYVHFLAEEKETSRGISFFCSGNYSFQQVPLQVAVHFGYFRTEDYNSRLTIYEPTVLYAFSFPSFYGRGVREVCTLCYDFNKFFTARIKISRTKYYDRTQIGTGLEQIGGDSKTDICFQLRGKF